MVKTGGHTNSLLFISNVIFVGGHVHEVIIPLCTSVSLDDNLKVMFNRLIL